MTSKTCHSPSAEISACWSLRETLHNQCYNPQNQFRRPLHTIHEDTLSLWRQMQKVPVASIQSARPRSLASTPAVENPPLQLPEGKQGVTPLQNYIGSSGLHWQTIQRTSKNQKNKRANVTNWLPQKNFAANSSFDSSAHLVSAPSSCAFQPGSPCESFLKAISTTVIIVTFLEREAQAWLSPAGLSKSKCFLAENSRHDANTSASRPPLFVVVSGDVTPSMYQQKPSRHFSWSGHPMAQWSAAQLGIQALSLANM